MPLTKTRCLIASCDVCGGEYETDYVVHFGTVGDAADELENAGWVYWKEHVWCEPCVPSCVCGHAFHGHDHGEGPCDDCECTEFKLAEGVS